MILPRNDTSVEDVHHSVAQNVAVGGMLMLIITVGFLLVGVRR